MSDYLKERYTHMERKFIGDDLSSEKHPFVEEILGYLDDCNKHLRPQEPTRHDCQTKFRTTAGLLFKRN